MEQQDLQQNENMTDNNADTQEQTMNNMAAAENIPEEQTQEQVEETTTVDNEAKLAGQLTEMNDKYLRLFAEFDNYKRRTARERLEERQTAGKEMIISLLDVLDDFDRTEEVIKTATDVNTVKEGVSLVTQKLRNLLEQRGLKTMEVIHKDFDADFHEAITEIPAPTEELSGKIIDQVQKGYLLNDKIIRFAKVVVGK